MGSKAIVKLEGDAKSFQDQIDKANRKIDQLKGKLRDTTRSGKAGGDSMASAMGNAAKQIGSITAGIIGANSVMGIFRQTLSLIRGEIDNIRQRRGEARDIQAGFAEQYALGLRNRPADVSAAQFKQLVTDVRGQQRFPVPGARAVNIVSSVLAAKGKLPLGVARRIALTTGREIATSPLSDEIVFAGGLGDILKAVPGIAKMQDPAMIAAGFAQQFLTQARAVDPAKGLLALGKTVAGVRAAGFGGRAAAALLATVSQESADPEARRSATGVINLASFIKLGRDVGYKVGGRQFQLGQAGLAGLEELQGIVQGMPARERALFLKRVPARAGVRGAIEGLVSGDPVIMAGFRTAMAGIAEPGPGSVAAREELINASRISAPGRFIRLRGALGAAKEKLALSDEQRALAGLIQEDIPGILRQGGLSDIAQRFANIRSIVGIRDPLRTGLLELQNLRRELGAPTKEFFYAAPYAHDPAIIPNENYDPQAAKALDEVIPVLQQILIELQKQKETPQPVVNAGPGSPNAQIIESEGDR